MSSQNIRKMVTTAILIALTIVFQLMRPVLGGSNIVSTYIIGSLINLSLIVATCAVGLSSGIAVAVVAPLIALWQRHATLPMLPWVIAGNAVLVIIYTLWALSDRGNLKINWGRFAVVGVIAALVKYAVMAAGQALVFTSAQGMAFPVALSTASAAQVVQIITAIIGMVLAGLILPALPASAVGTKASK